MTVYIVRADGTDLYKIGFTDKRAADRLRQLQTGCPHRLVLIYEWGRGTHEDEQNAHQQLAEFRRRGEWFELTLGGVFMAFSWLVIPAECEMEWALDAARLACGLGDDRRDVAGAG